MRPAYKEPVAAESIGHPAEAYDANARVLIRPLSCDVMAVAMAG
jgi:hypothetical protein